MHIDWTLNFSDLITLGGVLMATGMMMWKMHTRLLRVESWIETEGLRYEKSLTILDTIGTALTKVSALYEAQEKRVNVLETRIDRHHENSGMHCQGKERL